MTHPVNKGRDCEVFCKWWPFPSCGCREKELLKTIRQDSFQETRVAPPFPKEEGDLDPRLLTEDSCQRALRGRELEERPSRESKEPDRTALVEDQRASQKENEGCLVVSSLDNNYKIQWQQRGSDDAITELVLRGEFDADLPTEIRRYFRKAKKLGVEDISGVSPSVFRQLFFLGFDTIEVQTDNIDLSDAFAGIGLGSPAGIPIKSLKLQDCLIRPDSLRLFLSRCVQLQKLELAQCNYLDSSVFPTILGLQCLKEVTFENCSGINPFEWFISSKQQRQSRQIEERKGRASLEEEKEVTIKLTINTQKVSPASIIHPDFASLSRKEVKEELLRLGFPEEKITREGAANLAQGVSNTLAWMTALRKAFYPTLKNMTLDEFLTFVGEDPRQLYVIKDKAIDLTGLRITAIPDWMEIILPILVIKNVEFRGWPANYLGELQETSEKLETQAGKQSAAQNKPPLSARLRAFFKRD